LPGAAKRLKPGKEDEETKERLSVGWEDLVSAQSRRWLCLPW